MDKMEMEKCSACGVTAWHNPCKNGERINGRCTYCGYPTNIGNAMSAKREHAILIQRRQAAKAGRLA